MQEITSVNNQLIKDVHSLQQKKKRNELGLFLIEGFKGVIEALNAGIQVENIFINKDLEKDIPDLPQDKTYKVSEAVLKKISSTDTPPDIVATAHQLKFSTKDLFKTKNPLILLLENIKDPGNLGTIIRTSKACDVSGIILTDETVDIYNPKTVRSSAANLWKIPIIYMGNKSQLKTELNKFQECKFIATVVSEGKKPGLYFNVDYKEPTVLMFGSEAEGLSDELINQADKLITIPMNEQVESLNLSISVGVVLYESVLQRKFNKHI